MGPQRCLIMICLITQSLFLGIYEKPSPIPKEIKHNPYLYYLSCCVGHRGKSAAMSESPHGGLFERPRLMFVTCTTSSFVPCKFLCTYRSSTFWANRQFFSLSPVVLSSLLLLHFGYFRSNITEG